MIRDWLPHHSAVRRLPNSASGRPHVIQRGISGDSRDGRHAACAEWADLPPAHAGIKVWIHLLGVTVGRNGQKREENNYEGNGESAIRHTNLILLRLIPVRMIAAMHGRSSQGAKLTTGRMRSEYMEIALRQMRQANTRGKESMRIRPLSARG